MQTNTSTIANKIEATNKISVLVVGNGGREHALAWSLLKSPQVAQVFCTPGNGGTATMANCQNLPIAVDDLEGIARAVIDLGISLVVVGPELPLSKGIVDRLQQANILVFGPNQVGAQIEASKSWAKALMEEAGIPTAKAKTCNDAETAILYIQEQGAPIVVKADGLAAGKGVIVATTTEEAIAATQDLFDRGFNTVVIEECLEGEEVSVLALTDGITIRPLLPAQDHKRIGEGDTGNNTGGMGAYAPAPVATEEIMKRVELEVLQPTIATLQKRGIDYRGVLYAGLMITPEGDVKVLEFNCRFGDPETQAILPLLDTPLDELILACTQQKLAEQPPLRWKKGSSVCVVLAAGGYPGTYDRGKAILGIEKVKETEGIVFHAGTKIEKDQVLTDGGRVLGVVALGDNFQEAIAKVYPSVNCIQFEKMYYRRDIGHRVGNHH